MGADSEPLIIVEQEQKESKKSESEPTMLMENIERKDEKRY